MRQVWKGIRCAVSILVVSIRSMTSKETSYIRVPIVSAKDTEAGVITAKGVDVAFTMSL